MRYDGRDEGTLSCCGDCFVYVSFYCFFKEATGSLRCKVKHPRFVVVFGGFQIENGIFLAPESPWKRSDSIIDHQGNKSQMQVVHFFFGGGILGRNFSLKKKLRRQVSVGKICSFLSMPVIFSEEIHL